MIQDAIHRAILRHIDDVQEWFREQKKSAFLPFYSSFDLRDSSFKVAPVDANAFPAGFNNICQVDKESAVDLVKTYLSTHYPELKKGILLLTEEHTQNPYYWDNVVALKTLLEQAGQRVVLAIPGQEPGKQKLKSASGYEVELYHALRQGESVQVNGFEPELIISNNDFSQSYENWIEGLQTPINPPHTMGWHRRRKDQFFSVYNGLAESFARLIDIDPWSLQIETRLFKNFDLTEESTRALLAEQVQSLISDLEKAYEARGIRQKPFVYIKNNSGTYGLGVIHTHSAEEILNWSYKARKKMKAAKGGGGIREVILQEGVASVVRADEFTAEPVIYMVGCELAGGFLRSHSGKGAEESLNSPGAVYRRLCVSDLQVDVEGAPMENVYGWVARLSFLAVAKELQVITGSTALGRPPSGTT